MMSVSSTVQLLARLKSLVIVLVLCVLSACAADQGPLDRMPRSAKTADFLPGTSSTGIRVQFRYPDREAAKARYNEIVRGVLQSQSFGTMQSSVAHLRSIPTPGVVVDGVLRNAEIRMGYPEPATAHDTGNLAGAPHFIPVTQGEHRVRIYASNDTERVIYDGVVRFLEGTVLKLDVLLEADDNRYLVDGEPLDVSPRKSRQEELRSTLDRIAAMGRPFETCRGFDDEAVERMINELKLVDARDRLEVGRGACRKAVELATRDEAKGAGALIIRVGLIALLETKALEEQKASVGRKMSVLQDALRFIETHSSDQPGSDLAADITATKKNLRSVIRSL